MGESLLSVINYILQTPSFACYPFIISPHLATSASLSISIISFSCLSLSLSVSCVVGQVQRAMLTACPFSLAAGRTVTPVIQAHEHSVENACVCSQETMTVWGKRSFVGSARNS